MKDGNEAVYTFAMLLILEDDFELGNTIFTFKIIPLLSNAIGKD